MTLTAEQQANLNLGLGVLMAVAPTLGPNGALAATIVSSLAQAITNASNNGQDVSDEELQALFDQFEINKADDLAAQAEANAGKPS